MTFLALIVLAVLVPLALFDLLFAPTVRRLGLRNVVRRRGEAALVIGGSMLATALIVASMVVGDSFGSSIRNLAQDGWGPIDELVIVEDSDLFDATYATVRDEVSPIDGVQQVRRADVAIGGLGQGAAAEPNINLFAADLSDLSSFGGDASATGFGSLSEDLAADEIVLNSRLAESLNVREGSLLDVYAEGTSHRFTVAAVVEPAGMAGLMEAVVGSGVLDVVLPSTGDSTIQSFVIVSNAGDVYGGAERTDSVVESMEVALGLEGPRQSDVGDEPIQIEAVKQGLLEDAEFEAADTKSLFGTIGGFSVAAGILLVINLFVMLAAERKTELGVLRAVGMKRGHILRSFALEGFVYGVLAASVGAVLGIGVGALVMRWSANTLDNGDGFALSLSVVPGSVLAGAAIGLAISQLTVVLTSVRITKLNIVAALKDLPDVIGAEQRRRTLWFGLAAMALGAGLFAAFNSTPFVAMIAPVILIVGAIPVLGRFLPARPVTIVLSAVAIGWPAMVLGLMPDTMNDPDISIFLLQGILMVGLATVLVAALRPLWLAIAGAVSGGGVAMRLGLAHPLARPARTALLVAMYSLVIFTVTFMAVMNSVFSASTPDMATRAGGDYDFVVDSNPGSGLTAAELQARNDIDTVATVLRGGIQSVRTTDDGDEEIDGAAASFLPADFNQVAPPELVARSSEYGSDEEAWEAVLAPDANLPAVVVPDWWEADAGATIQLLDSNGNEVDAVVAGITDLQWLVDGGVLLSADLAPTFEPDVLYVRFYAVVADGVDPDQAVRALESDEIRRGVDASSFLAEAQAEAAGQEAFITILQGYLGFGLLIGIAGLGVVLARAIRERRRQIGMMRAVGFNGSTMRSAFVFEALFIGVQGVVLGIGLGLLSAWQTLTRSTAFEEGLTFAVPTLWLIGLAAVCVVASLGASLAPAIRSGRIAPAVALRH